MPLNDDVSPTTDSSPGAPATASDLELTEEEVAAARRRLEEQLRESEESTMPPIRTYLYEGPFGPYVVRSMRLTPDDLQRLADARRPPAGKTIYVRRTREPLELGRGDDWDGLDVDESIAAYDDLVVAEISAAFPDATVILSEGAWGCDGFTNQRAVIDRCREIASEVFFDFEWLIELKQGRCANGR